MLSWRKQPASRHWSQANRDCIGGDNKLAVGVTGRQNGAVCTGTVSTTEVSCGYIMDEMLKTKTDETFGRAGRSRHIQVALPLTLRARKQDFEI